MGEFSITHILLVAVIYVLFFGEKKLPELGKSIGATIRSFKQGLNETSDTSARTSPLAVEKKIELPTPADPDCVLIDAAHKESSSRS